MNLKKIKGRKILVTGHSGFKGTWLMQMLLQLGADICGYSLPVEEASFYAQVHPCIRTHIESDIREERNLKKAFREFKPEIVIHLASHSSLQNSDKIPSYIYSTNVMGVVNLFEAIRLQDSVKAVLIVTSDKCYRNSGNGQLYTEKNDLGAADPYSTSKACQEFITESYYRTFFKNRNPLTNVGTARASNVIGGGDFNHSRLIPYLLDCFCNGRKAEIRKPCSVRPWQYILDVLYGYLLFIDKMLTLAEDGKGCFEAVNFGPGKDGIATVKEVADTLAKQFTDSIINYETESEEGGEQDILRLCSKKAERELNWKPFYSLREALIKTAEFETRRLRGEEPKRLCEQYVIDYLREVNADV